MTPKDPSSTGAASETAAATSSLSRHCQKTEESQADHRLPMVIQSMLLIKPDSVAETAPESSSINTTYEEGTTTSNSRSQNTMNSSISRFPTKNPANQDDDDGQQQQHSEEEDNNNEIDVEPRSSLSDTSKKKKIIKKSVTFSPNGLCRKSLHIKNYSREERKKCWYSSKEMKQLKGEIQTTVKILEINPQEIDEIIVSRRGVEQYTQAQWKLRTARRKHAQRIVFKKQMDIFAKATQNDYEAEYEYSDDDAIQIALVYKQAVRESVASSYMRGVSMRSEELGSEQIYKIQDWSTSTSSSESGGGGDDFYSHKNEEGREEDCTTKDNHPSIMTSTSSSSAVVLNMNTMQTTLQKEGRIQMRRNSIINSAA